MGYEISPDEDHAGITVSALLSALGQGSATVLNSDQASPEQTHAIDTEFHDAADELPTNPHIVLLLPSLVSLAPQEFEQLFDRAGQLDYAAVAVKCRDSDVPWLRTVADRGTIPLIRVHQHTSWRLFEATLNRLLEDRAHDSDAHHSSRTEPLFALANELATSFGGSVAIEDLERRIIAYSSVPGQLIDRVRTQGILARRVPDFPYNDDEYRLLLRAPGALKYQRIRDEEPRIACAVRAGTLPLGTIWAIDASGDGPITADQTARITTAAAVAAEHLLDDLRARRAAQQPRVDRLRTLLDGQDVTGGELSELGISEEHGGTLCAFDLGPNASGASAAQLRSIVQRQLTLHHPEVVAASREGRVFALFRHAPDGSDTALITGLLPILDRLVTAGIRIALPGVAHHPREVAALRRLTERLLDADNQRAALARPEHPPEIAGRVLTVDGMRSELFFRRVYESLRGETELWMPEVTRLHTEEPALAATLTAWCANFGNVASTARQLGIHENTVRYRLRRCEEHYAIELSEPDRLLATWMQLRMLHSQPTPTTP